MLKVVYDVDDTLWGLNLHATKCLGIDMAKCTEFSVLENPDYTPEEAQALLQAFHDADYFQQIKFFPGACDIVAAENYGATVQIHSHCFTEDIAKAKRTQLQKLLPTIKPAAIKLALVTPSTKRKAIASDVYIFVDDNPYNIAASAAKFNFVHIWPWNTTPKAQATMTADGKKLLSRDELASNLDSLIKSPQCYIIYGSTLKEINQAITTIVKTKQEAKHGKI